MTARLVELWRYPFKSMLGERIDRAELGLDGLPGDRTWACRDEVRGAVHGAKKLPGLMLQAASYPDGDLTAAPQLRLTDGSALRADDPEAASRLSAVLDHPVTLWPRLPPDDLDHYRRGRPDQEDRRAEARATFGLDADDPFPDVSGMPAEDLKSINRFVSPPGTYFDAYPLLLVSRQSLAALARRSPGSAVDVRRFRPNLVVDLPGGDEFPEQELVGRQVQVGDAVVSVVTGCIRCVMISRPTAELPEDRGLQKVVVRQLHHTLGVYCRVARAGRVATGDTVRVR
jgi:uncharacterized protein YcbX